MTHAPTQAAIMVICSQYTVNVIGMRLICELYVEWVNHSIYMMLCIYTLATPSTDESRALVESQEIGDNYFAIGQSDQSSQGQQQTPLNPETIERNKNYLKAMDNFQVSWALSLSLSPHSHTHIDVHVRIRVCTTYYSDLTIVNECD